MEHNPLHKPIRLRLRQDATLAERLLWSKLRRNQTGFHFRQQESVGAFIADFLCFEIKLIVEVDGTHHSYPGMPEKDASREQILRDEGYEILRFSDQEVVESLEGVVIEIKRKCEVRAESGIE